MSEPWPTGYPYPDTFQHRVGEEGAPRIAFPAAMGPSDIGHSILRFVFQIDIDRRTFSPWIMK